MAYDRYGQLIDPYNPASAIGLDSRYVSQVGTPAQWSERTLGGMPTGYLRSPGYTTTTYEGPGGTFSSTGRGWTDAGGRQIGDLPGYLKMKSQQQTGADFGEYQNKLKSLLTDPSQIQETPAYQFTKQQGEQAINRSAAAKGMLNSGSVLAELQKYGSGLASQEYSGQVNRLAELIRGAQQFGASTGYYTPMNFGYNPSSPSGGTSFYTRWA